MALELQSTSEELFKEQNFCRIAVIKFYKDSLKV